MRPDEIFLEHLPLIEEIASKTCRRRRLKPEDTEDFVSLARMKFLADDYQVLRRFEGRSQLSTYITTVVQHLFLDYCNQTWGRYRPSTEAQRGGPLAIEIEKLVVRDDVALMDAVRTVAMRHPEIDAEEIRRLADRLPRRPSRRREGDDELESLPSPSADPEADLVNADQGRAGPCRARCRTCPPRIVWCCAYAPKKIFRWPTSLGRWGSTPRRSTAVSTGSIAT
jgi:DNA-directed RNA polymerase specialized sigma24 family protein